MLDEYFQNQIEALKKSELYSNLVESVKKAGLKLKIETGVCSYLEGLIFKTRSYDYYITIDVMDNMGNTILGDEIEDEYLHSYFPIIKKSKKKIYYFTWEDEDLIQDIEWMIKILNTNEFVATQISSNK